MKTKMYRKTRCANCDYIQEDSVSYYLHAKAWKANHNLENCLAIRKSKKVFDEMFSESLDSLANLSIR
jgi:glutaredoxin-related protein